MCICLVSVCDCVSVRVIVNVCMCPCISVHECVSMNTCCVSVGARALQPQKIVLSFRLETVSSMLHK